jgi:hypothetical protein
MNFNNNDFFDDNIENDNLSIKKFITGDFINDSNNYNEDIIINIFKRGEPYYKYNDEDFFIIHGNKEEMPKKINIFEIDKSKLKTTKYTKKSPIFKISKEIKKKNKGRKKSSNIGGKHNKFSNDNMIRKIKSKLLSSIISYLNSNIKKYCLENNIKSIIFFVKTDQKYIQDTKIKFNLKLMNTKLKDIFSDNISSKYINLGSNFNKKLVKKIYKNKKQNIITNILERTFFDCLEQVRGRNYFEELKGLEEEFKKVVKNMNETDKYIDAFNYLLNRFKIHFESRKSREKI